VDQHRYVASSAASTLAAAVVAIVLGGIAAWLLSSAAGSSAYAMQPRVVSGLVTHVSDGDTIHVTTTPEQTKLKVRLYGIDAQETAKGSKPGQPYGETAKAALVEMIGGKQVVLQIMDVDRYRRMVGLVWLLHNERCANLDMIREGHAEALIQYLVEPYKREFMAAQAEAQAARRGIWAMPDYETPSTFRKRVGMR